MTLWRKLRDRVGRRGAFLAFLAILDFCYGWALMRASIAALKHIPDFFLPLHTWGWIWMAAGLVCATGIFAKRTDRIQYSVAASLKACWGALYFDLWVVQGTPGAWISVVIWFSFALTVLLISGWPEVRSTP